MNNVKHCDVKYKFISTEGSHPSMAGHMFFMHKGPGSMSGNSSERIFKKEESCYKLE